MSRRFAAAVAGLSATIGLLLGLIVAGSMTPAPAASAPSAAHRPVVPSAPPAAAPAGAVSFADIAERLNPAVVNIDATSRAGAHPEPRALMPALPDGPDRPLDRDREGFRRGAGTGFLIDADGHILTNDHVVEFADRLTVRLRDGRSLPARRVGVDPDTDMAVIMVDAPEPLPFAPLGDSDRLRVGEWVVAIGNPLAYEHTLTAGVVSFIGRKLFNASFDRYIQTDAAINFGNSGGPLINTQGEVVGINSAISSRASNIGFAVPINQARTILPQLLRTGRVSRGYIGVGVRDVDPDLQRSLRLRTSSGAVVQDVTAGSPGARAGLRIYDLIVAVDGKAVSGDDDLIQSIAARQPGTLARLQIVRDNRPMTLPVKLAERPRADEAADDPPPAAPRRSLPPLGLSVRDLDREFAMRTRLPGDINGVVVSRVEPMSAAFDAHIERGHVLLEINREPTRTVRDYQRIVAKMHPGDVLAVQVYKPELLQRALQTITIDH
jgi:serine protease Do